MRFGANPLLSHTLQPWRGRAVLWVLLGSFAALAGRALFLQGLDNEDLQQEGESRFVRSREIPAARGNITDRHGAVLAKSMPARSLWASCPVKKTTKSPDGKPGKPGEAATTTRELEKFPVERVPELARLLEMETNELSSRLAELRTSTGKGANGRAFVYLKRQLSPEVAQKVADMKIACLGLEDGHRRVYPGGEITAHVLGFTNVDDHGQEGIEAALNRTLKGHSGMRKVIQDRRGQAVEELEFTRAPREGGDLALAIDNKLQFLAFNYLKQSVEANRAKGGGAVVLDVLTGEVLALTNLPTFDPNNRVRIVPSQLRNRALTDNFEPGSTLKPFTVALALDKGKVRPNTQVQTAPGHLTIGSATISDAHPHGMLTVSEIIQKSSNVGSAKIAAGLAAKDMWEMFDAVGYGKQPQLGFPGEASGRLRPYATWRPIEQATMSYGHGISLSLMQLAHSYLVFARDGDILPLSLTRVDVPPQGRQVFAPQTARDVRAMLELAVLPGGTAPKAQVPGYRVAGKTGTAYKLEGGGYARDKYVSSFVGLAPASHPRLVVAVMIDEPSAGLHYGGDVAAPVFSQIMAGSLRALGLEQDQPPTLQAARDSGKGPL